MPNDAPNSIAASAVAALASLRVRTMLLRVDSSICSSQEKSSSLSKILPYAAAGAMALGAANTADASVQHYTIGADQLVGQTISGFPHQSVGLATIDDELQLVYGTGSSARRHNIFLDGVSQTYAPANSFWGSTGVQNNQGDWELYGMRVDGQAIRPDGSAWNTGLDIASGIAYLGNDTFLSGGLLAGLDTTGFTFTNSDGTLLGSLDVGSDANIYLGLQHDGSVGNKDIVYGTYGTNTLDGFWLDMNGQEIVQQITFPELEGKSIRDLQRFSHEGSEYVAVAWSDANGGGVQVYTWNIPAISAPCPGDVTGSGGVDLDDLNVVLSNFGQNTPNGDANNDGVVDLNDLNIVLSNFGTVCP